MGGKYNLQLVACCWDHMIQILVAFFRKILQSFSQRLSLPIMFPIFIQWPFQEPKLEVPTILYILYI